MILIDTDVLIDVALDNEPFAEASAQVLDLVEQGYERACIAWHSISNLYYIVSPRHGGFSTRDFIVQLTHFVEVATTDAEGVRYAASLPMNDFEDALQVAAARECGATSIVTRNLKDYTKSPIPAISPAEAIGRMK